MNPLALFLWLKSSKLGQAVAAVLALLGAVLYIFSAGKRAERRKQKVRNLEREKRDRQKLDALGSSNERDTVDRLRKNGF